MANAAVLLIPLHFLPFLIHLTVPRDLVLILKACVLYVGIVHTYEFNTKALISYLLQFLHDREISVLKLHGLGLDGTNTMSGNKWRADSDEMSCP